MAIAPFAVETFTGTRPESAIGRARLGFAVASEPPSINPGSVETIPSGMEPGVAVVIVVPLNKSSEAIVPALILTSDVG